MRFSFAATVSLAVLAMGLGSCASIQPAPPQVALTLTPTDPADAHNALFALFKDDDEATLKLNPMSAIYRGDLRYADRFGDYITDAYYDATRAQAEASLARLHQIDRAWLNETDQVAYDVFDFQEKDLIESLSPRILPLTRVRPLNHFYGFQSAYPTFASGKGGAPFATLLDYENNLRRHAGYVTWIDRAIGRFREGEAAGVVETKMTIRNVIEQLDNQLAQKPETSQYYTPVTMFPASIPAGEQARLKTQYRAAIVGQLMPATKRLRDFLATEYLPRARDGSGEMYMKGGDALYRYQIKSTTTTDMTPEQIHALGLSEVARITSGFKAVQGEIGYQGNLPQFFDYMRTNARFQPKSRQALTYGFYAIGKEGQARIPGLFSSVPKAKLAIRPYDPTIEKFQAGGSYEQGTPDGSRPGTFYFNAYNLPERQTWGMTTLFLHEGEPGHHFQVSLAQENDALPPFMKFGGNTAYVEGWALYAETLGYDMGFYKDPYARFGTLNDEMLRAMRLVVDTGLHSKGWTREQSIAYMLSHSGMGKTDAIAEVERYIAIPSQATAYKVGALTIQKLRKKAETELGPKFNIRDFHAQVLMTGALPLAILEAKIDRWIATRKAG
ncbi:DUF885 domain-containing protein [Sphingomonas sp. RB1R13]|uniref:DUF885 domain-containing protein n=1 Tax=Sphingomonas sp. RB1R13 TaxID=3096159 RepID=UPI002FC6FC37